MAKNEIKTWAWVTAWGLVAVGVFIATGIANLGGKSRIGWQAVNMDGHRSGVVCVTAENVDTALGTFDDAGYVTPSGIHYPDGSPVSEIARVLMEVQPQMARLKQVVGHSARELRDGRDNPDLPLANLFVDELRARGSRETGIPMDMALVNFGGIRVPLPAGPITLDDISSMFPFQNYVCYCKVRGENLTRLLEQLAATKAFQAVSGVQVKVKAHKLESALVGGQPIDPERIYNVTTIDFLLDGGDKINMGALSEEVTLTHLLLKDVMLDYIRDCEAKGIVVDVAPDGRVIMED